MGYSFVAVPHFTHDLFVAVDDLLHARFDGRQVIEAERRIAREVVIEAVFDGRADGDLGSGEQFLHRLGHHVTGIVADGFQRLGAVACQDFELAAAGQSAVEIVERAIKLNQ